MAFIPFIRPLTGFIDQDRQLDSVILLVATTQIRDCGGDRTYRSRGSLIDLLSEL